MTDPLVSVVMIFKDAAAYIEQAAESVLAQTWPHVELLLVDDGGTDGSHLLAGLVADRRPDRARVLSQPGRPNRGMSAARALGIEHARGELVAFLDADDVWDPGHLAHEVALLQAHPEAGMVLGRAVMWHSWDGSGAPDNLSPLPFAPGTVVPPPRVLSAVLRRGRYTTPICSLLVRTDALRASGGPDPTFTSIYEDQVLLARLYVQLTAVMSGAASAHYRQHPASAVAVAWRNGSGALLRDEDRRRFLALVAEMPQVQTDPDLAALVADAAADAAHPALPAGAQWLQQLRQVVPPRGAQRVRRLLRSRRLGRLRLGTLLTQPLSREFGYDRGLPVDRWYVERFLARSAEDVRGRVLEIGDNAYTTRYGGGRVTRSDVLNIYDAPGTTFVADLADAPSLPDSTFDCVLLTQTLHLVYDMAAAVRTLHRVLAPGGVLLLTVPGITPLDIGEWGSTWYWSLTQHSARRLVGEVFGDEATEVQVHGNVLAATAFLHGFAADEVQGQLAALDLQFPVVVTVRALKPA